MDRININDLAVDVVIGVYAYERLRPQKIIIDLSISCDLSKAAKSDDISDSLDYALMHAEIIKLCNSNKFKLLESLAASLIDMLLCKFIQINQVSIRLSKPEAIPGILISVELNKDRYSDNK